jgi:hypothetical protein
MQLKSPVKYAALETIKIGDVVIPAGLHRGYRFPNLNEYYLQPSSGVPAVDERWDATGEPVLNVTDAVEAGLIEVVYA